MKLFLALLVLAITPVLTTARPAEPQGTNRASSHDRHHHRHSGKGRHHHRQVSHHRNSHQAQQ